MRTKLFLITTINFLLVSTASAQTDTRVRHLRDRILTRVPDVPVASRGLGRGNQRYAHATNHAQAIVAAADSVAETWEGFDIDGFDVRKDLPALLAAIAYRESSFQPVIRLNDNTRIYAARELRRQSGDVGFMQVRIPGAVARACGANRRDTHRLLTDHAFNYQIGACILTRSLARYIEQYERNRREYARLRPARVRRFYREHPELEPLAVIERYNWGHRDLYESNVAGAYSKRILSEYLFFKQEVLRDGRDNA